MTMSIAGKTAIVTGSANGVGLAIARHFLAMGANVMFADRDEDRLEAEDGIEARAEGNVRMFAGDLRQKLTIHNLLSATMDAFDRVDILVNASRQVALSDPLDPDGDAVEALLEQNLLTGLRLSQMTARRMVKHAKKTGQQGMIGAIVNLSSIAASRVQPALMGYSISCAAVDAMTRSMAVALAAMGIRVNAVAFGSVMSTSLQDTLQENPDYHQIITDGTPLRRIASANELAETVQYLVSDAAAFITGQVITVDGGRSLLDRVQVPAH